MRPAVLSSGITVRPFTRDDAAAVFAAVDADRVRLGEFMPWVWASRTPGDTAIFLRGAASSEAAGSAIHRGLFEGDRYVGSIGASIDRLNGTAEAGYWISADLQGRGVVTEAMGLLIDALVASGVRRVVLRAAVENVRSRRVAERLGFTLEGVERESMRTGERIHDVAVYSLLAREWPGAGDQ
jgi:ribosomal-protein-serine acetyltransferase